MKADKIEEHLAEVEDFLDQLAGASDSEREEKYRRISKLIRFVRRFYEDFFEELFGVQIESFTFDDKRLIAEKIVDDEGKPPEERLDDPSLELAYSYLDLCDQMQGELAFGYAIDAGDFVEFHKETFPEWLRELADWLESVPDEPTAKKVRSLSERYRRAV